MTTDTVKNAKMTTKLVSIAGFFKRSPLKNLPLVRTLFPDCKVF